MSYRSSFRMRCWPREKIQAEKTCKKYEMTCASGKKYANATCLLLQLLRESTNLPGIMKNAANVEIAVMVTLRSRLPPNITVQILEAPPPGEQPVTKRPSLF